METFLIVLFVVVVAAGTALVVYQGRRQRGPLDIMDRHLKK